MMLNPGDILFQDIGCGAFCTAISDVTRGIGGARIDHCAIATDGAHIIEAIYPKVALAPLGGFLNRIRDARGRPKVIVGRVHDEFRHFIPHALDICRNELGKSYDSAFADDDVSLYCSELLVTAFNTSFRGTFFEKHPMSFKDPRTGRTHPLWETYFRQLRKPVPEGVPGSNPGGLSRSSRLNIVHQYGDLDGLPLAT